MTPTQTYAEEHEVDQERSLGSLIKEIRDESIELFHQEIELARTEMAEKAKHVSRKAYVFTQSTLVSTAGLIVLLMGIAEGLSLMLASTGVGAQAFWIGPVVVGLVVMIGGAIVAVTAKNSLMDESIVPEKTAQTLKENKQWLNDKTT
ncbi:phage holin family protein [Blastopirellula marina]|uniref:Phage holin family protein n=1 Tax=Blastopirellula marina TaxID=124 RepID=A0A2S8FHM2_9BACT|nr:phage holin family protein [Blastopirellula marina]PQO31633.1 hypothetical protein C5Y98_19650 [Blastopirellula marina]PTL42940.1 phage holin family protein [Blastopirellula marina]